MIDAPSLLTWLHDSLRRPDLAARLEQLLADDTLDEHLRLLHFAHELWPDAPPLWRGRLLEAATFDHAGEEAMSGSQADAAWLASATDPRIYAFFESHGRDDVTLLHRRWTEARTLHDSTWGAIVAMGGPTIARPSADEALAITARVCFSDDYAADLRQKARGLLGPSEWLRRLPWFLQFGSDVDAMHPVRLEVLRRLDGASVMQQPVHAHLDRLRNCTPQELQELRQGLLISPLQERSFNNLELVPNAPPVVLQPGERHFPAAAWTLGREMHYRIGAAGAALARGAGWLLRGTGRFVGWLRRRRPAAGNAPAPAPVQAPGGAATATGGPGDAASAQPVATYEVRGVPVRLRVDEAAAALQVMLVRISWSAPQTAQVRLHLSRLTQWRGSPLLKLRTLPAQGQFLLLLHRSTRVRLQHRDGSRPWYCRWPWHWRRLAPIDLWLPEPVSLAHGSTHAGALRQTVPSMKSARGPDAALLHPLSGTLVVADPRMVAPRAAEMLASGTPRALQTGWAVPRASRDLTPQEAALLHRYRQQRRSRLTLARLMTRLFDPLTRSPR